MSGGIIMQKPKELDSCAWAAAFVAGLLIFQNNFL
jgi:hypothetical protein